MVSLEKKIIILVTGANQVVGFECAKNLILSSADYHVLVDSRSLDNGQRAAAETSTLPDLKGSAEAIQIDMAAFLSTTLASAKKTLEARSPPSQRLRDVFTTNTIGSVLVTDKVPDLPRKSSTPRLVFVSSSGGSLTHAADPNSPHYGSKTGMQFSHYRASKTALNMLLIEYHKALSEEGFKVMGADPGLVVTNFLDAESVRALGAPGADVGGRTVAEIVKGERDVDTGRVVGRYVSNNAKFQVPFRDHQNPGDQIFNSRDDSFSADIIRETDGKALWKCIAEFEKLVGLGKRDIVGFGKLEMGIFEANRSYCCVDTAHLIRHGRKRQDAELSADIRGGQFTPIRHLLTNGPGKVTEAFRCLQNAESISQVVPEIPQNLFTFPSVRCGLDLTLDPNASHPLLEEWGAPAAQSQRGWLSTAPEVF
ncbi:short-chain dehydrogenase/reductase [Physcia stellaris]|nr:short-chain dehydrogenase/reductase [Physcia stellaris]